MTLARCPSTSLVDDHFEGRITLRDERTLRPHLEDCPACRDRYRRRLLLQKLDPAGQSGATVRLGRPLGLSRSSGGRARSLAPWLGALAVSAAVLLLVGIPRSPPPGNHVARGTVARPGETARPVLQVFRLRAGRPAAEAERLRAGAQIRPGDELAFAYVNPGGRRRLMIYAVDHGGEVRWFQPAWTDPASNPVAVAIQPSPVPVELPAAVSHRFATGPLRVQALFTDQALPVQQVEAWLKGGGLRDEAAGDRWELELKVVDADR